METMHAARFIVCVFHVFKHNSVKSFKEAVLLQENRCLFHRNTSQYDTGGRGLGSEHAHQVQVELGGIKVLQVALGSWRLIPVLLPGDDTILGLDVPQRVVVWTDVVRTAKQLPDDEALLGQRHKAVPQGYHGDDGRVNVLNVEQVS